MRNNISRAKKVLHKSKKYQLKQKLIYENKFLNNILSLALDISKLTIDYKELINTTVKNIVQSLGDAGVIHLLSENEIDGFAEFTYNNNEKAAEILKLVISEIPDNLGGSLWKYVIKTGESIVLPEIKNINNIFSKSRYKNNFESLGLSKLIIVPLLWQNKAIGALSLLRYEKMNSFNRDDLAYLQNTATILSFAISNSRLLKVLVKEIEERKMLMRELYHRTKNNLQVISSLLRIKSDLVENDDMKNILEDMGNRIQTIALVHQKLYQSKSLSHIDLKDFITDLSSLLMSSYSLYQKKVIIELFLDSIVVSIDKAIPCGLIINELISNSLKYAFPGDRKGRIMIHLHKSDDGTTEINISDDGIGIPDDNKFMEMNTLGMLLLKSIAEEQLQGKLSIETNNGVSSTIRFKDILY
ncbi:MAG: histidine kinase dimerization/phosphoacceptor domain -containing protein [Ignavibacteriaceae bacterium]|nr:histidine kinase dimerization/phosphoacceptor domain -containing protein [Ignavibacteriaceae bacterium]